MFREKCPLTLRCKYQIGKLIKIPIVMFVHRWCKINLVEWGANRLISDLLSLIKELYQSLKMCI